MGGPIAGGKQLRHASLESGRLLGQRDASSQAGENKAGKLKLEKWNMDDVLKALWERYTEGDQAYVIAHPKRGHPMTEMQAYTARSYMLEYADSGQKLWLSRAQKMLLATKKRWGPKGKYTDTVADNVRSRDFSDY